MKDRLAGFADMSSAVSLTRLNSALVGGLRLDALATSSGSLRKQMCAIKLRIVEARNPTQYSIDQGSPCPLATLNPFGRELLLSDVFAGLKRSTRIERIL
jgi:hypothetical protein